MADIEEVRRQHGYHSLRVGRVVQETDDTRSFVLDVPDELRDAFRYRAGQFCTFRVRLDGSEHLRSYSMSSAPETDREMTVTVKRVPGGLVSNWFNDHVAEGSTLELTRPAGVFCVQDGRAGRPVLAFCGGSGVTPVISIAKSVLATGDRPVRLLYANRDRRSVIFEAAFRELGVRYGPERLTVRHHFDEDAGYLDPEAIAAFVDGDVEADVYICGPTPFMDLVESTVLDLGVPPERILIERFATSPAAAPDTGSDSGSDSGIDEDATETVVLILNGKRTEVAYRAGDTVLETARRGGLKPPFSCEAGNCATCMAILREGSAKMRANNALTADEVEEGWILTCQALPQGRNITVEYESF